MVGEWIVDVISFQKIFGLCCLKCHIVEIWRDVTFVDEAVFVYLSICIWVFGSRTPGTSGFAILVQRAFQKYSILCLKFDNIAI